MHVLFFLFFLSFFGLFESAVTAILVLIGGPEYELIKLRVIQDNISYMVELWTYL
jgi:hypothetical protein